MFPSRPRKHVFGKPQPSRARVLIAPPAGTAAGTSSRSCPTTPLEVVPVNDFWTKNTTPSDGGQCRANVGRDWIVRVFTKTRWASTRWNSNQRTPYYSRHVGIPFACFRHFMSLMTIYTWTVPTCTFQALWNHCLPSNCVLLTSFGTTNPLFF